MAPKRKGDEPYMPSWAKSGISGKLGDALIEHAGDNSVTQEIVEAIVENEHKGLTTNEKAKLRALLYERAIRKMDALYLYQPQPHQVPVHRSNAKERLVFGSNQSGKTTSACVEVAWIATNQHPYLKYPKRGDIFVVGRDQAHLAHTLLPKLIDPIDSLRIIRDLETNQWRQYQPLFDSDRYSESKQMGPLIPERMIRNIAWENFGKHVPAVIDMKCGWRITFFTAAGKPPAGAVIDFALLDEEVGDGWMDEISPRLMAKKGKLLWSATPQVGGQKLIQLHDRCQRDSLLPDAERNSEEFFMLLANNTHIDEKEKQMLADKYANDPDQYRVRILGQFLLLGGQMYPQWSETANVCQDFEIPEGWCRYMVVDPGHTVCCVLFFAVPPPADPVHGGHVYLYKEVYIRECDPSKFADEVRHHTMGIPFQSFIIDDHGSRRHDGIGGNMRTAYTQALAAAKVRSVETGNGFIHVSADVKAGCVAVREMINRPIPHNELPTRQKLQVFRSCTNVCREFKMYFKKRDIKTQIWLDDPDQRNNHGMDCLRYMAMHGAVFVAPRKLNASPWSKWKARLLRKQGEQSDSVFLCAGSGAG